MCFFQIALQGCPQQKGEQGEGEEECSRRRGRRRQEKTQVNASQVFGGGLWGRCMNEEEAWVCVLCHMGAAAVEIFVPGAKEEEKKEENAMCLVVG
jgi:hypothetical protein